MTVHVSLSAHFCGETSSFVSVSGFVVEPSALVCLQVTPPSPGGRVPRRTLLGRSCLHHPGRGAAAHIGPCPAPIWTLPKGVLTPAVSVVSPVHTHRKTGRESPFMDPFSKS